MSFGTLYGYEGNPRTNGLRVVAKENKLDIKLVTTMPGKVSDDYLKYNKLGKIPTFVGADGYVLSEMPAIAIYLTSQNEKTTLLGKTKQDYASILRWVSFANHEVLPAMGGGWIRPLLGLDQYNKKSIEASEHQANRRLKVMEDHLMINTYLVGERLTLADIIASAVVGRGMQYVLDKKWRDAYPSVTRWYTTVANQPMYKSVIGEPEFCAEAIKYTPPAKEKAAPKQEAKKAKPAAAAAEQEEDEPVEAPKPKHVLEALGKPTFALDEWKRTYKNEETREVALPWFWEKVNFEEYSVWQVDYKYNDELTMTFMTSNLIGGFFARLEASRKYIMGCASVYGVANDSVIRGAFVIRGQDAIKAFDVAPDWESYEFTKLDHNDATQREIVNSMWAWDKPIEVKGKVYEWADGKIFV